MRPDFSQIHPLKRLTLVALQVMLCVTVTLAICLQFCWIQMEFSVARRELRMAGDRHGLLFSRMPPGAYFAHQSSLIQTGDYAPQSGSLPSTIFAEGMIKFALGWEIKHRVFPGISIWNGQPLVVPWLCTFVRVHHAWLIGITGTLYLVTRWRIRRSERRHTFIPPPPSPSVRR